MGRRRNRSRSRGSSQRLFTRRRVLAVLTAGGVGAAGLQATGAFDGVNAQRDLEVATADDGRAFLAINSEAVSGFDGDTVTLLKLTNRFEQPLTSISATVVSSGNPIDPQTIQTPVGLAQGESGPVQATLNCATDGTVEIQIVAASDNQRVQIKRFVQVTCKSVDVCAPRQLPSGCVLTKIPKKPTDCSVKIDKPGQIDNSIAGRTNISGAAEFLSQSQVKLDLRGNATVQGYLKIDTPSQIEFSMKGNSEVENGLKLRTDSQLELDIRTQVSNGLCVENAGAVTFSPNGGSVDGDISITSTDQVTIEEFKNADTDQIIIDADGQVKFGETQKSDISGDVDITAAGQVTIGETQETTISGNLNINASDQVTFSKLNDASIRSVGIDADSQVKFEETNNTVISRGIDVNAPSQVTLDTLTDVLTGPIDINADGQVDIITNSSVVSGDIAVPSAGGEITINIADSDISGGITTKNEDQVKLTLTEESAVGKAIDIDTNSQVDVDLETASLTDDLIITTDSQVKLSLAQSTVDGTVSIKSQSQVEVTLKGASISGDLNITTPGEVTISDCSAVEGTVKPQNAC